MLPLRIQFEAVHPEANVFREYSLWIGQDLFGFTLIDTYWGRKGYSQSQGKRYAYEDIEEAGRCALLICRKRLKAAKRIGCNYTCISHDLTLETLDEQLGIIMCAPNEGERR